MYAVVGNGLVPRYYFSHDVNIQPCNAESLQVLYWHGVEPGQTVPENTPDSNFHILSLMNFDAPIEIAIDKEGIETLRDSLNVYLRIALNSKKEI